ncbi:MAG: hypothetical protein ACJAUP_001819 [Cellvibrionaceae bacterium]|jgi:hypothetical protein
MVLNVDTELLLMHNARIFFVRASFGRINNHALVMHIVSSSLAHQKPSFLAFHYKAIMMPICLYVSCLPIKFEPNGSNYHRILDGFLISKRNFQLLLGYQDGQSRQY